MRLGVLDIGSNSAQLQIVEATAGEPLLPLHAVKAATRLGESIGVDQCLDEDGIDRVSQAVTQRLAAAHRYEVDEVYLDEVFLFVTAASTGGTTDRFGGRLYRGSLGGASLMTWLATPIAA